MSHTAKILFFLVICILIIVIIVLASGALIYQIQYNNCKSTVTPYCYTDWMCRDPKNPDVDINMSEKILFGEAGVVNKCLPLTSETLYKFTYVNEGGITVTTNPSQETNIWANCIGSNYILPPYDQYTPPEQEITPDNIKEATANCPTYKAGDIYWPACNNPMSRYYVSPDVYDVVRPKTI